MSDSSNLPVTGFLRLRSIIGRDGLIPVSKSTWWAGIKDGRFPKPVKLSIGMQKGPPIGVQKGPPRGTAEQAASEARPWRRSERAACGRVSDSGQERFLKRQLSLPVSTMSQ